jgi:hypothetical protein
VGIGVVIAHVFPAVGGCGMTGTDGAEDGPTPMLFTAATVNE